jgi:hypothetical protein
MTTTYTEHESLFGDMIGPLTYWGPVAAAATAAPPLARRVRPMATRLTPMEHAALSRLSRTLHGRTWAGTNTLMSALFAAATEPVVAR